MRSPGLRHPALAAVAARAATAGSPSVLFDITHTWDADLDMFLTPPGGAALDINTDNGGSDPDFILLSARSRATKA